nr:substrate-binding domain-containing protein [Leucobacter weissii]
MLVSDPTKPGAPVSSLAADVCIVTDPFENDPVLTLLKNQHIPALTVGVDPARPGVVPSIDSNTRAETFEVLDHLESAGGTTVGLALGTDRNAWNLTAKRAYVEWCGARGREPIIYENPETRGEAAGERIAAEAFDRVDRVERRPDAIYCLTGRHASGLVAAARSRGIRVPEDLLVAAGSDALQNRTGRPTVTAMDLRPEETARRAVELAVQLFEGSDAELPTSAPGGILRVRESTSRDPVRSASRRRGPSSD